MPRIGLISDSHGQSRTTARAAQLLADAGADILLHLGDLEEPDVLDALRVQGTQGLLPVHIVLGNVDWQSGTFERHAQELGIVFDDPMGRLDLGGDRSLAFTHGHRPDLMAQALAANVTYLCHGHTHRQTDERHGATRVINPGALQRAAAHTVAMLDTERDQLQFFAVGGR